MKTAEEARKEVEEKSEIHSVFELSSIELKIENAIRNLKKSITIEGDISDYTIEKLREMKYRVWQDRSRSTVTNYYDSYNKIITTISW